MTSSVSVQRGRVAREALDEALADAVAERLEPVEDGLALPRPRLGTGARPLLAPLPLPLLAGRLLRLLLRAAGQTRGPPVEADAAAAAAAAAGSACAACCWRRLCVCGRRLLVGSVAAAAAAAAGAGVFQLVGDAVGHGHQLDQEEVETRRVEKGGRRVRRVVRRHHRLERHGGGKLRDRGGEAAAHGCFCYVPARAIRVLRVAGPVLSSRDFPANPFLRFGSECARATESDGEQARVRGS